MNTVIDWLDAFFGGLPLPLLEVWGRFSYVVGLALAICAFGGFHFRPGARWGLIRERQAWDAKAVLSIPITFVAIIVTGYLGSFKVLVPGAQTFESLKDMVVFLCVLLFGYPALIAVAPAYMLADLIEGVPPDSVLSWAPGYFFGPAFVWMAYQLIGRNPDFRRARTWTRYGLYVVLLMLLEPVMWGYICSDKFTPEISYGAITPALLFTLLITWLISPFAMLAALPLARRYGMFWAEIPRHVKERLPGAREWTWKPSQGEGRPDAGSLTANWPIRMVILLPFIGLTLLMVGATAYVTLHSAGEDASKLATRLHQEISDNINLQLDEVLAHDPAGSENTTRIDDLLRHLPVSRHGLALIINRSGKPIASSAAAGDPIALKAVAGFKEIDARPAQLATGVQFRFNHVTKKPPGRTAWLARATAYQDRQGGHADWIVLTVMPESYYLAGVRAGNSRSAMIFALALVLSLAMAAVLAGLVTRQLRQMSMATEAMAHGRLAQRVPGSRLEELDILARSFNGMAEQLEGSFDDLRGEVDTRKRRERELEESEARMHERETFLRLAQEAAHVGSWEWDLRTNRFKWSDELARMHGIDAVEFDGRLETIIAFCHPDDVDRLRQAMESVGAGMSLDGLESRIVRRDGGERDLWFLGRSQRDERGTPVKVLGVAIDITERKLREEENRELTGALGERVKELTCLRKTAEILQDNRLGTAGWLREIALILPQGWLHPEAAAAHIRVGNLDFAGPGFERTPWLQRAEFVDAAGTPGVIELAYLVEEPKQADGPFLAEERNLIDSVAEMLRSALNRRYAEEALREEKRFIDTLMDSLPGVVFLCNEAGRFLKWNKVMEQVTGRTRTDLDRMTPLDLITAEDADDFAKSIRIVLATGQHAIESDLVTKDGTAIPYYFKGVRLPTEHGPWVLGIGIDISDRRRLEDQFRQAQKMEAVGHLAAGVAHDFNNLLTIISSYTELLLRALPAGDPKRRQIEIIQQTGGRAAALTRQLLAFSRNSVLQPKVLDPNHVVEETENMLRRVIGEDVRLTTVLDPDIRRIKVDPGHLGQVLMNLSVNARDAMPQGGRLTIETRNVSIGENDRELHATAKPGSYVLLTVSDTGCGMSPEVQAHIFEPFFTTKDVGKGTGLGLAMVYGIVEQSGGSIEVRSEVGHGTTFLLYFAAIEGPASFQPDDPSSVAIRHGTETVLVVEDEAGVRDLATLALEPYGYEVLVAGDGIDALSVVDGYGQTIDLLVTDVVMPGLSGRELAEALCSQFPDMRVLYVSGYTDDAVVRHGLLHEEIEFLEKPYTPLTLAKKVGEVLDAPKDRTPHPDPLPAQRGEGTS
jgi:PAS domain S-box-containing protein